MQDLEGIYQWINNENSYNAAKFVDDIEKSIKALSYAPEKFPRAYESQSFKNINLHQTICQNHRIIYRIGLDTVDVLTILSCRQDLIKKEHYKWM